LAAQQPREWSYEPLFGLPVRHTCLPSRGDRQAQTGDLTSLIPFFSRRGLGAGLPCLAPPSRRTRNKQPRQFRLTRPLGRW